MSRSLRTSRFFHCVRCTILSASVSVVEHGRWLVPKQTNERVLPLCTMAPTEPLPSTAGLCFSSASRTSPTVRVSAYLVGVGTSFLSYANMDPVNDTINGCSLKYGTAAAGGEARLDSGDDGANTSDMTKAVILKNEQSASTGAREQTAN